MIASASFGSKIYARVLTRNLSGKSIRLKMARLTRDDKWWRPNQERTIYLYEDIQEVTKEGWVIFEIQSSIAWKTESNSDKFIAYIWEKYDDAQNYTQDVFNLGRNLQFMKFIENAPASNTQNQTISTVNQTAASSSNSNCPRCNAAIRGTRTECRSEHEFALKEIFPNVSNDKLKTVADTYSKYMGQLGMNTCWQKAHFFAQAAVETGYKLDVSDGEKMRYTWQGMLDTFPSKFFVGAWSGDPKRWKSEIDPNGSRDRDNRKFAPGKEEKIDSIFRVPAGADRRKAIANIVYAGTNGNGDESSGDGWRFRGSGLVQLTGRGNFQGVYDKIKLVRPESILTDAGAEKVRTNLELAVLTSMGYFKLSKADQIANGASSDSDIKLICEAIGRDITHGDSTNHKLKIKFFKEESLKLFKTTDCQWNKIPSTIINTSTNEFGLIQVTKLGNPYIINNDGSEDTYSYQKLDGSQSTIAKHGDDWMLPKYAYAFNDAVYKLVSEYPNQKIILNDCSAYNPSFNLGHSRTSAHQRGTAFDIRFLTVNGLGSNVISNLSSQDIKINARFIEILKETGCFHQFYTDKGKIPGSTHQPAHDNHIHGNG